MVLGSRFVGRWPGSFPRRKRIESISALIVGEVEPTFHAYESFLAEAEKHLAASRWLLEEVAYFSLTFETPDGPDHQGV